MKNGSSHNSVDSILSIIFPIADNETEYFEKSQVA